MTIKDKSTVQRELGRIEGVAFAVDEKIADILRMAVRIIDEVISKE